MRSAQRCAASRHFREVISFASTCRPFSQAETSRGAGGRSRKRSAWLVLPVLSVWPHGVFARQVAANAPLDDKQLLGMRLFNQSCRVCHTRPQLTSPLYGPALSRESL